MISYSVKYKTKGQWFWRTIKKVKGDALPNFMGDSQLMIISEDETVQFIPIKDTEFKFSKERHALILKRMEDKAGTKISLVNEG